MTRLRPCISLFAFFALLLSSGPLQGQDVATGPAGIYEVDGKRSDGTAYTGLAHLRKWTHQKYWLTVVWTLQDGTRIEFGTPATFKGSTLAFWHDVPESKGIVNVLENPLAPLGVEPGQTLHGTYKQKSDGNLAGDWTVFGSDPSVTGNGTWTRKGDVSFTPEKEIIIGRGETRTLPFGVKPDLLAEHVRFELHEEGGRAELVRSSETDLVLDGEKEGKATLQVLLGKGQILAERTVAVVHPLEAMRARVHRALAAGKQPIVGFDLDGTLFDDRYRSLAIFRAYGEWKKLPRLRNLTVDQIRYEMDATLREAGFNEKEIDDLLPKFRGYWFGRFFDDDWLSRDEPVPGGLEFVKELHRAGATILYLTARKETAREASRKVMEAAGFPFGDRVLFHLKPSADLDSAEFKADLLKKLHAENPVVGWFENDPENANAGKEAIPTLLTIHLHTWWNPEEPPVDDGIPHIPDYTERDLVPVVK